MRVLAAAAAAARVGERASKRLGEAELESKEEEQMLPRLARCKGPRRNSRAPANRRQRAHQVRLRGLPEGKVQRVLPGGAGKKPTLEDPGRTLEDEEAKQRPQKGLRAFCAPG